MLGSLFDKAAKKDTLTQVSSCEYCETFDNSFLMEDSFFVNGLSWMNILGENVLTSNRHSRSANLNPNMGSAESKKKKDT